MVNNINQICESFFNFELPCPTEIKNCEKLRKDYEKKVKFVDSLGLCTPCEVVNIKNFFINTIKQMF